MRDELDRALGERDVPLRTLLFAGLGPGLAWGIHLNLVYFLTALYCTTGQSGADIATYAATAALLGVDLLAGWVALRNWRRLGKGWSLTDAVSGPGARTAILLFVGMAGSVLFGLVILVEGLVPMFVRTCSLTGA
jgi:hypothetical protein